MGRKKRRSLVGNPLALPLLLTGASLAALWGPCHYLQFIQTLRTVVLSSIICSSSGDVSLLLLGFHAHMAL